MSLLDEWTRERYLVDLREVEREQWARPTPLNRMPADTRQVLVELIAALDEVVRDAA